VPNNDFCRTQMQFTNYAIDVAHLNVDIVNAWRDILSSIEKSDDINPLCSAVVNWVICIYRFPPCEGFKLIIPCAESCNLLVTKYIGACLNDILRNINSETDAFLNPHFGQFSCRDPNDYYSNFTENYFTSLTCFQPMPNYYGK